jgi:transposase-like protein
MISESIRRRGISVGEVSYKGHRDPAEIIAHCVWLYHRFPLSFREVEELMLVRGVIVSYETIRQWCAKFGPEYACRLTEPLHHPIPPSPSQVDGANAWTYRSVDTIEDNRQYPHPLLWLGRALIASWET